MWNRYYLVSPFFLLHHTYFWITTVTTVTIINTLIIVIIVTTVNIFPSVTSIIVKYKILLLYSSKGNFFTKVAQQTDQQKDQQRDQQTTRLLELRGAAKDHDFTWKKVSLLKLYCSAAKCPLGGLLRYG